MIIETIIEMNIVYKIRFENNNFNIAFRFNVKVVFFFAQNPLCKLYKSPQFSQKFSENFFKIKSFDISTFFENSPQNIELYNAIKCYVRLYKVVFCTKLQS